MFENPDEDVISGESFVFSSRMAEALGVLLPFTVAAAWFVNPTLGYWVGGVVGGFAFVYYVLFAGRSLRQKLDDAIHDGRGVRVAFVATVLLSVCLGMLYTFRPTPAARSQIVAWIARVLIPESSRKETVTTKPEDIVALVEPVPNPFDAMNEAIRNKDEALRGRDEKIADLQFELEVMKRVQAILEAQRTAPPTAAATPPTTLPPPILDSPPTSAQSTIEMASVGRLDEPMPPPVVTGPSEQQPPVPQPVITGPPTGPTNLRILTQ